ncbi:testis-expressed protein 2-like [Mauremys reevesii]|uniref:testis-expressed protein 2-like n=1 Tax=Mauremys reevesii TaxID=260615 RepID=UPI00193FFB53|nr:testis-expressed protein 2-like [Mauremys reevesii]
MAGHAKASLEPEGSSPASFSPPGSPQRRDPTVSSQEITSQFASARSKEDWENLDGSELIFTLDKDEEEGAANSPENAVLYVDTGQCEGQHGSSFHRPFPPASPPELGFLTDIPLYHLPGFSPQSSTAPPNLQGSPGPKPLINLVKSLSTEIQAKESCPLKPQPLLNLVKSISTEISHLEPEVTQSKSDSKLNVHLWRQITQPKSRDGDSRTAPSSPNISPSESKGSFFKVQEAKFEDTKRRFSEAMQEPLSRLSKIIGDENSVSAKYKLPHSGAYVHDSPSSHSGDCTNADAKAARPSPGKVESDWPGEHASKAIRRTQAKDGFPLEHKWGPALNCKYEICSCGDVIQVVEVEQSENGPEEAQLRQPLDELPPAQPASPVPCKTLACVAILAYNYFILPLPPYLSGLCLGLACGFVLGFLVILLFVPKPSLAPQQGRHPQDKLRSELLTRKPQEPDVLKSWMNEMYFYDPEIYHPSLTHSVFVTLEGSAMKLSYPKNNVPRRATFEEETLDVAFVSHRHYDMSNAQVFLFPPGLARKRMWNKKYPICILFPDQEDQNFRSSNEHDMELPRDESLKMTRTQGQDVPLKPPGDLRERTLYLFGRTGRDKEEWFQHLMTASRGDCHEVQSASWSEGKFGFGPNQLSSPSGKGINSSGSSRGSTDDIPSLFRPKDLAGTVRQKILLDYSTYMSRLVQPETGTSPLQSPCHSAMGSPTPQKFLREMNGSSELSIAWMNALVGRIFWDFLREKYWMDQVSNKIQKKLSKIKLPYFMNELTLTELDMGTSIPLVLSASNPIIDNQGLWVDLEVIYNGALQMTLETKMNLCKLGKEALAEESRQAAADGEGAKPRVILLADSDAESSSAGSSDEEDVLAAEPSGALGERIVPPPAEGHGGSNSTSRKILRFVDKIAKSKYFQKATENEFIKKKIEEVSNTPLLLTVEVQELSGTLAVNIPPPPTDRIWYSFRIPPQLELKVHPKLGEREVTFIHVTEWIERKLQHEFQKILVMPNMDDLIIPIMHSGLEPQPPLEGPFKDLPADSGKWL